MTTKTPTTTKAAASAATMKAAAGARTRKSSGPAARPRMPLTEAQIARGDWNPLWDTLRDWDPEFVEGYLAMRSVPFGKGPLPDKTKELVLIAVNAATTHLYGPGVRRHIQNALRLGATRDEILQVIEIVSVVGIHACNLAVPILAEELAKA